jgi:serine phosphatase RsbU (regulator of sigma subunit)
MDSPPASLAHLPVPPADFLFLLAMVAILLLRFNRASTMGERLEAEMEAARTVQQILVPEETPSIPGFSLHSVYKPASQVGGDFFQILPTAPAPRLC